MGETITDSVVAELHTRCRAGMEKQFFQIEAKPGTRQLDVSVLLDNLAWNVLAPILVTVTGGIINKSLEKRAEANDSKRDPKIDAKSTVGKQVVAIKVDDYETCLGEVESSMKSLGGKREHAEVVVKAVLKQLNCESPKESSAKQRG